MLSQVAVGRHCCPDNYRPLVGDGLVDEMKELVKSLSGAACACWGHGRRRSGRLAHAGDDQRRVG